MDATRVLDLLVLARAFVEAGWCKNRPAKSKVGRPLRPTDDRAVRFCILGATERAWFELLLRESECLDVSLEVLDEAVHAEVGRPLTSFNDDWKTSKKQVLALFDAACERVGKS
jgi:hypothetical protein